MKKLVLDDAHLAFLDAIFDLALKHSEKAARPYINTLVPLIQDVEEPIEPQIVS